MISYDSICEKLGFDLDTYQPSFAGTEDDSKPSPFKNLNDEELDWVGDYLYKKMKSGK